MNRREGKISCHTSFGSYRRPAPQLKKGAISQLPDSLTECTEDLATGPDLQTAAAGTAGKSAASLKAAVTAVAVSRPKPPPETPDIKQELKRGSMKERWGVRLVYHLSPDGGLGLAVVKVTSFTAGHRAKIVPGDKLVTVNDWHIGNMEEPQVAANLIRAAGFSVTFGPKKSDIELDKWNLLDDF